ncbi:Uncharacterized protein Fot_30651 [Forsythia ovata]|uniref:Uncharacterized protein n=1 Tax=Forsythia ovata TaxID=205694 RepID=A0ABD1T2Q8_9LAMI
MLIFLNNRGLQNLLEVPPSLRELRTLAVWSGPPAFCERLRSAPLDFRERPARTGVRGNQEYKTAGRSQNVYQTTSVRGNQDDQTAGRSRNVYQTTGVRGNQDDQTAGRSRKSRGANRRRSRKAGGPDQTAGVRCSRSEQRNFKKILQTTVVQEDEHTLISVNVVN